MRLLGTCSQAGLCSQEKAAGFRSPDEDVRAVFDTPALLLGRWWLVPPACHAGATTLLPKGSLALVVLSLPIKKAG